MPLFNFVIGQRVLIIKTEKTGIILNRGKANLNQNTTRKWVHEVNVYSVQTGKNKIENFGDNELEFISIANKNTSKDKT